MPIDDADDYLMISGLKHLLYCERRCALIHVEQAWQDNLYTVWGDDFHKRVDIESSHKRKDVKVERSLPLRSDRYKLIGKADIVEFRQDKAGNWIPKPVEYKVGKPNKYKEDEVQLCAQALCLAEMSGHPVPVGELYYGKTKEKISIAFDQELLDLTEQCIKRFRELMDQLIVPPAEYGPRCKNCSLVNICLPKLASMTDDFVRCI